MFCVGFFCCCCSFVDNAALLGSGRQRSLLSLGTGCVSQNWYLCLAASSMFLAGPWHADSSSTALWISCSFCIGMAGFYDSKGTQTRTMTRPPLLRTPGQTRAPAAGTAHGKRTALLSARPGPRARVRSRALKYARTHRVKDDDSSTVSLGL